VRAGIRDQEDIRRLPQRRALFDEANQETKDKVRKIRELQFLWAAYSPDFWWWEVIDMARKMLMVGIPFLLEDRILEAVLGVAVCASSMMFYLYKQPFADTNDYILSTMALFVLFLQLQVGTLTTLQGVVKNVVSQTTCAAESSDVVALEKNSGADRFSTIMITFSAVVMSFGIGSGIIQVLRDVPCCRRSYFDFVWRIGRLENTFYRVVDACERARQRGFLGCYCSLRRSLRNCSARRRRRGDDAMRARTQEGANDARMDFPTTGLEMSAMADRGLVGHGIDEEEGMFVSKKRVLTITNEPTFEHAFNNPLHAESAVVCW
jgi:hypothetical protein